MLRNNGLLEKFKIGSVDPPLAMVCYISLIALISLACSATQRLAKATIGPTNVPLSNLSSTETREAPTPEQALLATVTATPVFDCPKAPKTQLQVGDLARVTFTEGPSLRLRRDPVLEDGNILKLLSDGTEIEIIDGPKCFSDPKTGAEFIFWKISIHGNPLKGWVVEGDAKDYFIEPLPK